MRRIIHIHTDAVKENLIPKIAKWNAHIEYAKEADLLNLAVFGHTASEWRKKNPEKVKNNECIRDSASIIDLLILEELQIQGAELIKKRISKQERYEMLCEMASVKRAALSRIDSNKSLKKINDSIFLEEGFDKD